MCQEANLRLSYLIDKRGRVAMAIPGLMLIDMSLQCQTMTTKVAVCCMGLVTPTIFW